MLPCKDNSGKVQTLLKPIWNIVSSALPWQIISISLKYPTGLYAMALIGTKPVSSHKVCGLINIHCWTGCLHVHDLIPHTDCGSIPFLFFIYRVLSKQSSEEKTSAVHLFLNAAKPSQPGNRMEKRQVCGQFSCSFLLRQFSGPLAVFLPECDPVQTLHDLANLRPFIIAGVTHGGVPPTWVFMSLLYDLTVYTLEAISDMEIRPKPMGRLEAYWYLGSLV